MSRILTLALAGVGGVFLTFAFQSGGEMSLTQLSQPVYYLTLAFIAFVNAALFAADGYVDD
jgi:hypothetical protein